MARGEGKRDRYDWITLWVAIAGVIVVAVSTGITAWQAVLTRRELDSIMDNQRAWVSVEPRLVSDIGVWPTGQIYFELELVARNAGSLPAQWVRARGRVFVMGSVSEQRSPGSPLHTCGDILADEEGYTYGPAVFPNQEATILPRIEWPSEAEARAATAGEETARYVLVLCTLYYTGRERELRLTGAIYSVRRAWRRGEPLHLELDHVTPRAEAEIDDLGIGGFTY